MICEHCGAEIKDSLKFCNKCGTRVRKPVEETISNGQSVAACYNTIPDTQIVPDAVESKATEILHSSDEEISKAVAAAKAERLIDALASNGKRQEKLVNGEEISRTKDGDVIHTKPSGSVVSGAGSKYDEGKSKSRILAGLIGVLLGVMGLQWFYLGRKGRGWLYLIGWLITAAFVTPLFYLFYYFCIAEGFYLIFAKQEKYEWYINLI